MVGIRLGVRCYKSKEIGTGKACVIVGVLLGLVFAAVSVYYVTVLYKTSGTATYLVWFSIFGYFLLLDIVVIRMMFFTKWAKRMMGTLPKKEEPPKRRVMTIDDVGKDWEKRIAEKKNLEEE